MHAKHTLPLSIKIPYLVFVLVWFPVYWAKNGPANFLWGSDLALILTGIALWTESRLLASMTAVGVLVAELAWNGDFLGRMFFGIDAVPGPGTAYMWDAAKPIWLRGLSLFHVALPVVTLWLVYRLGYDRRALLWETLLAWIVLPLSFWIGGPEKNINWTYGFGHEPQTWLPDPHYLAFIMVLFPLAVFLPTHLILKQVFSSAPARTEPD